MNYLNGWTKEKVIVHVKANFKGKSVSANKTLCMYRGDNGTKCVAGLFIPDEMYVEGMERNTASSLLENYPMVANHFPFETALMRTWQTVHDGMADYLSQGEQLKILLDWIEEREKSEMLELA